MKRMKRFTQSVTRYLITLYLFSLNHPELNLILAHKRDELSLRSKTETRWVRSQNFWGRYQTKKSEIWPRGPNFICCQSTSTFLLFTETGPCMMKTLKRKQCHCEEGRHLDHFNHLPMTIVDLPWAQLLWEIYNSSTKYVTRMSVLPLYRSCFALTALVSARKALAFQTERFVFSHSRLLHVRQKLRPIHTSHEC